MQRMHNDKIASVLTSNLATSLPNFFVEKVADNKFFRIYLQALCARKSLAGYRDLLEEQLASCNAVIADCRMVARKLEETDVV